MAELDAAWARYEMIRATEQITWIMEHMRDSTGRVHRDIEMLIEATERFDEEIVRVDGRVDEEMARIDGVDEEVARIDERVDEGIERIEEETVRIEEETERIKDETRRIEESTKRINKDMWSMGGQLVIWCMTLVLAFYAVDMLKRGEERLRMEGCKCN